MKQFFFTILYQPLYNLLFLIAWLLPNHSIGWSIVILTILIRVILLPSSLKAAFFQVKNYQIQPKINKIKNEIKDAQEQNKAIMELYKQEGHSPFGSCLQSLIQLPILIVLYQVFAGGLTDTSFSSLYDFMPRPEAIGTIFFGFNLTKPDPWVLPIVAGLLQFLLSWMMMPPKVEQKEGETDPTAMMSRQMLFLSPIITVFFGRSIPAALVIYWIVTTVFSIGQQIYVNNKVKDSAIAAEESLPSIETGKEKVVTEKPAGKKDFMLKMMRNKLDKQDKKSGVNVTIRTKKKW